MFISAVLFFISALGCAIPQNLIQFLVFRFIGGLAIGSASIVSPLYISEVAPPRIRGALVSVNQLAIVTGILMSYFVSWILVGAGASNWRWMFATGAIPAVVFFLFVLGVPESPRWLVKQGREEEATTILTRLNGPEIAAAELVNIKETLTLEGGSLKELLQPGFRTALFIGVFLAVFQQITGINAVIYYAPRFFEAAGLARSSAILQSALIGVVNVVFTLVAIALVDRLGRKPMLMVGSAGMGLSFILLGRGLQVPALFRRADPALHPALHRLLRHDPGPDRLGGHRRDLPDPHPRSGHGHRHGRPVAGRFRRLADLPGHRRQAPRIVRLLALRGDVPDQLLLHLGRPARDEGQEPRGDRAALDQGIGEKSGRRVLAEA